MATAAAASTPRSSAELVAAVDFNIKPSPKAGQNACADEIDDYDDEDKDDEEGDDEDHDEEDDDDAAAEEPANAKGAKNPDKRKCGGSSKGRKCYRWSRRQEDAVVNGMLEIRAEGEILGDACFKELHSRLVAKYDNAWNHTVSGIHNAWHRRHLVNRLYRAEARVKKRVEMQEKLEDEELGLIPKEPGRKAVPADGLTTRSKRERPATDHNEYPNQEDTVISSKRVRRTLHPSTPALLAGRHGLPLPAPPVPDFPTVTVHIKPHNNNSRRTRLFEDVNDMAKFWNQVVGGSCFSTPEKAFMVVSVAIDDGKKAFNMVQHDRLDYAKFLVRVEAAVDAAGKEDVEVDVKAVIN